MGANYAADASMGDDKHGPLCHLQLSKRRHDPFHKGVRIFCAGRGNQLGRGTVFPWRASQLSRIIFDQPLVGFDSGEWKLDRFSDEAGRSLGSRL